ncbi:hypothetical protein MLD38_029418 [Melastoma candidum]|uniref:Uncharacterized protein n=1 Tax=Melastoma candidum TaxID=119954 RepID=A0ACB9N3P8_9MYRT|nr:hypothetical protein MLD38_029418 [Melastoma candidum]
MHGSSLIEALATVSVTSHGKVIKCTSQGWITRIRDRRHFQVNGPSTYQIGYAYIYRRGPDGLRLKRASIQGYNKRPVTFLYHADIPSRVWLGFNRCQGGDCKKGSSSRNDSFKAT